MTKKNDPRDTLAYSQHLLSFVERSEKKQRATILYYYMFVLIYRFLFLTIFFLWQKLKVVLVSMGCALGCMGGISNCSM